MPLASQCFAYLRASRASWRPRQSLQTSKRTCSSTSEQQEPRASAALACGTPKPAGRKFDARSRHHGTLSSPFARRSPADKPVQSTGTHIQSYEDDLDCFKWNDFVASKRETQGTSNLLAPRLDGRHRQHYDTSELAHELVVAQRKDGRSGVLRVWSRLVGLQGLSTVEGAEADFFYKTVLEAALSNDVILDGIHTYAEWLVDEHDIRWPNLYEKVVSHCLEARQYRRAFLWHIRLMAGFDPGQEVFRALITRHVHTGEPDLNTTLQSLYITSHHRNLYDTVVPRVYGCGKSALCIEWRDLFTRFDDLPQHSVASQPFLHFLRAYYPGKILAPDENMLASAQPRYLPETATERQASGDGHTEPSKPKSMSDAMCARFLASSWIAPEFAVHALQGLGVHSIGPLSLQSLALRDPCPASVVTRLAQLERLDIRVGESAYVRAIRHFAQTGNDELLLALLRSDIHPEVFDDPLTQRQILSNAVATGDWQTSRLLLAIQPAIAQHSVQNTSNAMLREHVLRHDVRLAIGLMADMRAMKVDLTPGTVDTIYTHLLAATSRDIPLSPSTIKGIQASLDLAHSVASLGRMIPSQIWLNILYQLGNCGHQRAMETLALALVDNYRARAKVAGGLITIHHSDLPPGPADNHLTEIPMDLPFRHAWHPITRILGNRKFQTSLIRWGFKAGLPLSAAPRLQGVTTASSIQDYHVARGAKLLQELADRGIPLHMTEIGDEILHCIAERLGPKAKSKQKLTNRILWTRLPEVRRLFTLAMGEGLLPQTMVMRDILLRMISSRKSEMENPDSGHAQ